METQGKSKVRRAHWPSWLAREALLSPNGAPLPVPAVPGLACEVGSVKKLAAWVQGLLVGLAVATLMLAGVTPVQAAEKVTVLHVFVAVGQSNMSGRGLPSGTTDNPQDSRIFQYGAKLRTLGKATIPLDMLDTATGISPATAFAREYLKYQPGNVGVLIIPAAHGATAFTSSVATRTWSVGTASAPKFDLPSLAVTQTRQGIAAAEKAGYTVKLTGILWHQGEGNWWMSTSAYSAKLDQLIAYFRSRLGAPRLPFVVGGLAPEGIAAQPGSANVDKSHKATPARVPYTGFAPSMAGGVNTGDRFHFSRTGVDFLGKMYVIGLRKRPRPPTVRYRRSAVRPRPSQPLPRCRAFGVWPRSPSVTSGTAPTSRSSGPPRPPTRSGPGMWDGPSP